ncbi:MAG: nitroreductase/quinone reductase family protein [Thermoflexales bacterium]|nr:nitroreductase/quinone reductase family protein [Thermoflexales bacterium]
MVNPKFSRWMYRDGRPNWLARAWNAIYAMVFGLGIGPSSWSTLSVRGRKSGKMIHFPVVVGEVEGRRYLVSMLGERAAWVKNVRAAGGAAVLRHGRAVDVTLVETAPAERLAPLRDYVRRAPGGRPHLGLKVDASDAEIIAIMTDIPVFEIRPRAQG